MNKSTPCNAGATYKGHGADHAVVRDAWDNIWVEQHGQASGLRDHDIKTSLFYIIFANVLSQKEGRE